MNWQEKNYKCLTWTTDKRVLNEIWKNLSNKDVEIKGVRSKTGQKSLEI